MLSKTSQYALRAAHHLARAPGGERIPAVEVAKALAVPANYLSKILHALGRAGILVSERGPNGGFTLARSPASIPLSDILQAFDEHPSDERCLLGRGPCRDSAPCPAHGRWKEVSDHFYGFFEETTLADLGGGDLPATLVPDRGRDDEG